MTTAHLQGATFSAMLFVLKICTDTYKIIDKNIHLLTIRLGGKPCERLGEEKSWFEGGVGGSEGGRCGQWCYSDLASSWGSSGAASTCGREQTQETNEEAPVASTSPGKRGRGRHLVGFGLSVLRVVLLVGLCLGVLLRLLGLLVLLLVVHSLFFLFRNK